MIRINEKIRKTLLRSASGVVLIFALMINISRPVQAQMAVVDAPNDAIQAYDKAYNFVEDKFKQAQADFNRAIDSVGKNLQTQIQTMNTDTLSQNAHNATLAGAAAKIGADAYRPPTSSSCNSSRSAATAASSKQSGGAVAKALAVANQSRPDDPVTNAQEIKSRAALNFTPSSAAAAAGGTSTDPDASAYKALNLTSDGTHQNEDTTVESLLYKFQLPVDPNLTLKNNVYQPITKAPSDQKYYPFDAALSYCEHVTPPQPMPPQAPSGKASVQLAAMGPIVSARSAISIVPGTCYKALEYRMQYGTQNASNFPALYPDSTNNVKTRHDEQVARCIADHNVVDGQPASAILSDQQFSDCQQYGRSDMQADHDLAFRRASVTWQTGVLSKISNFDNQEIMISMAEHDELDFQRMLIEERTAVVTAIAAANNFAHSINTVSSSALSQPISQ